MKQAAPSAWSMPTHYKGKIVSSFKVTKKPLPGTPEAQKLLQRFGKALVCVRHRVTPDGEARCTTVELVLEQVTIRSRTDQLVGVQVGYADNALQSEVNAAASVWDPALRLWKLPPATARKLGLSNRVLSHRNEMDVESISIQKSCVFPDLAGCRFKFFGIN